MYLEDFFEAANIDITVGYGLTETSPVIATRFESHNVRGSAGIPLPGTSVKIRNPETREMVKEGETGELLVKGPSVIEEYYKSDAPKEKYFDAEGYFNTGDLVYRWKDGDIVVTGRYKDLIVLSNGENVEPGPIEDALTASRMIDQVMIVGEDEKHLAALIVPNLEWLETVDGVDKAMMQQLRKIREEEQGDYKEIEEKLNGNKKLVSMIKKEVTKLNSERPAYSANDAVRDVKVLARPFTVENKMMTQTLKIKKNVVLEEYKEDIERLYGHKR